VTTFDQATGLAHGSFGIATFRKPGSSDFPALVLPDATVFDLSSWYRDTHAILEDWDRALQRLNDLAASRSLPELRYESLVPRPVLAHPNVLGAGANYRQHVAEMMTYNKFNQHNRKAGESDADFFARNLAEIDRRAREGMPFFWIGLHSALVGANDNIELPLIGQQPDWELEFGVVVARTARYRRPTETGALIAGYVMVNDLGTVDEFRRADVKWGHDWVSKSQPTFKPFGPFLVPKEFVDRSQVRIHLAVNGRTMQDWPITDMIFSPEQILSYATERIRLLPGDLLFTGSPPGNGAMRGQFLKPGDIIESSITYLGRQKNLVVAENAEGRAPTFGPFITEW